MSYFEDASLVLIPSAVKISKAYSIKPTDGTGDLTFTRTADTATRVASNGLIERVRTNLALHSNAFNNAVWDNIGSSETSGQAGYDGTNNAWFLTEDSSTGNHLIRQFPTLYGLTTLSVYAKAGSRNFVYLRGVQSSANVIGWFNLSTGAVGTVQANGTGKIENVGGGWYRCSLTVADFQSPFELYVGLSNADNVTSYTGNGTGNILIQNFQYETGGIATDYIATTTASVSVGMLANTPRLDYSGGASCPKLLLEGQRTNIADWSENFSNWSASLSVSTNFATSPDGYQNADKITSSGGTQTIYRSFGGNANCTASIFAKKVDSDYVLISYGSPTTINAIFRLTDGVCTNATAGITTTSQDYGNGWWRFSITTTTQSAGYIELCPNTSATVFNSNGSCLIWGAQYENLASYASSYINTLNSAVTRGADSCSKTGISSLIGQTEGTLFADFVYNGQTASEIIDVSDGTENNRIMFYVASGTNVQVYVTNSGTTDGLILTGFLVSAGTQYKIAIGYKANDLVLYINGTQIGTDTSLAIPATSKLTISNGGVGNYPMASRVAQALLFKTRLTNAQLAELTTI